MHGRGAESGDLAVAVATAIRQLRLERGVSLSELARRAGVGKATLSGIEAARRNATLETLYAIAAALEVPLADLIAPRATGRPAPGPAPGPTVAGTAVSATLLETFEDGGTSTELYRLSVRPGRRQISPPHGPGVTEHLTVTAGTLLAGPAVRPLVLEAGTYARFTSDTDHVYEALGTDVAQAVLLVRHPRPPPRRRPPLSCAGP